MMDRSNSNPNSFVDSSTPLLRNPSENREESRGRVFSWDSGIRGAARFLRRASNRRIMRQQPMMVRETAAEQLEERQDDWAYSKPIVVIDISWNLVFMMMAFIVLIFSGDESPSTPLRVFILGYVVQCILHIICVCIEYRRRHMLSPASVTRDLNQNGDSRNSSSRSLPEDDHETSIHNEPVQYERSSVARHLESANTIFSFIWWVIGSYWAFSDNSLIHSAPNLHWLCLVFLGFDVLFVLSCLTSAFMIGIAVCCFLPCIIAILYAVVDQVSVTDEDINNLARYKFAKVNNYEKLNGDLQTLILGKMIECNTESPMEHVLSSEDAECCICLACYEDGVELLQLPCMHHFHSRCIDKWLHINATCPLCKFNILKNRNRFNEV